MDDGQTLRYMVRDDAYRVMRVLKDGPTGKTELVTLDGEGPLVRKYIPAGIANASAWATAMELAEPLLPRIESLYRTPDELVVVYEYVEGRSLDEMVRAQGRLEARRAARIMHDVCRAVSALHEAGVVHRDITPGNVIVATDGAHLVDLGIARRTTVGQGRDTTVLGTWGFAAPEQFGFAQTDARSDVYALGKLLGYLITGLAPDDEGFDATLGKQDDAVGARLATVVHKATAFEPSARYQSAAALDGALRLAVEPGEDKAEGVGEVGATPGNVASIGTPQSDGVGAHGRSLRVSANPLVRYAAHAREARRGFGKASLARRVLALLVLIPMGLFALYVAIGSLGATVRGGPDWGPAEMLLAILVLATLFVMACEVLLAATQAGPYARGRNLLLVLLMRLCMVLVSAFVLTGLIGLAFGKQGQGP